MGNTFYDIMNLIYLLVKLLLTFLVSITARFSSDVAPTSLFSLTVSNTCVISILYKYVVTTLFSLTKCFNIDSIHQPTLITVIK